MKAVTEKGNHQKNEGTDKKKGGPIGRLYT